MQMPKCNQFSRSIDVTPLNNPLNRYKQNYLVSDLIPIEMRNFLVVCVLALVVSAGGSNYDAYLADLDLRNREAHDAFRRSYPNGAYVLDYVLTSPDFYLVHPILREYESEGKYEGNCNAILSSMFSSNF